MRRQLLPAVVMVLVMTLLTGLVYTFAFTGFAQLVLPRQGRRVTRRGGRAGRRLRATSGRRSSTSRAIRSRSTSSRVPRRPRPRSEAGYDPTLSLGSNLGPTNPELLKVVRRRVRALPRAQRPRGRRAGAGRRRHRVRHRGSTPTSRSPTPGCRRARVAEERGLAVQRVRDLIDDHIDGRFLGIIGEKGVNVLLLNVALDETGPKT